MKKISVSFLSSKKIVKDLMLLNSTDTDFIHVDVKDGKFVSGKNDPFRKLDKLSGSIRKRLDVHLMVKKPFKYILKYARLNTECITIHIELEEDILTYLDLIKSYGIKCGLAINPETDINILEEYLEEIDQILVMSVNPGKGGQPFIEDTTNKLKALKKLIGNRNINIVVDGGINDKTKEQVMEADILVSGSYVLNNLDYQHQIDTLR